MMQIYKHAIAIALLLAVTTGLTAYAESPKTPSQDGMMSPGLMLPAMDAAEGRRLFATKGCVVCHSVNGVGGEDAPMLDAEFMDERMNPFDFAAKMWRGAPAMVAAQEEELGYQIEFTGQELANITAFIHDQDEQAKFTTADIPEAIRKMMMGMK